MPDQNCQNYNANFYPFPQMKNLSKKRKQKSIDIRELHKTLKTKSFILLFKESARLMWYILPIKI